MTGFDHAKALAYRLRPVATDKHVSMDVIVTAIPSDQLRECCLCDGRIRAGEVIRARFEISRGQKTTAEMFRACTLCCVAMAAATEDGGRAIAARRPVDRERRSA